MEKRTYIRPGERDTAGNPIGFKAGMGSKAEAELLSQGFVPLEDAEELTEEEMLSALTIKELRAQAEMLGIEIPADANLKREIVAVMIAAGKSQE